MQGVERYLYRKGLKAMCLAASFAFRQPKGYPTPSVFHADQRGVGEFLILTLGPELWPSPSPWGTPTSASPGTDFRAYFIILGSFPSPWGPPIISKEGLIFEDFS